MTRPAFIIAAKRTAVAPANGAFRNTALHDLAAPVLNACLASANLGGDQVDDVILANALYGGGNPARMAALAAGLPQSVAGLSLDRQCVGGLDAIWLAAQMIGSGQANAVLAGGAESHSLRPIRMTRPNDDIPAQPYERPAFAPDADHDVDLDTAANHLATKQDISKEAQDAWAADSHRKALANDLSSEIVSSAPGFPHKDPFSRSLTTKICGRAKPIKGTITAANMAVSADAAAFVLVVSEEFAKNVPNDHPCQIITGKTLGADPREPGLAPVPAIQACLTNSAKTINDFTCFEVMEAYAAQAIACVNATGMDPVKVNMSGGALARGHPIGASGAVLAVRLYHQLQTGQSGLAAIAAAGGLGSALILSR